MREWLYQILFYVILFLAISIEPYQDEVIEFSQIGFFAFYALVANLINYVLLPKLFYKGKTRQFWLALAVVLLATYFVEELLLEPLLVGGKRAEHVSNIFWTLLSIIPTIFMMVGFKFILDTARKQREINELKGLVQESEMRFLKSQIHPHFLFNHLNNLYAYALEKSARTPELILELSSVLRYMLYDCQEQYVPLSKELAHVKDFVGLNEIQLEDKGKVTLSTNLENNDFSIAPLLLSVFIENAFKHSTSSLTEGIEIDMHIDVSDDGQLKFSCSNNHSVTSNKADLGHGIGLENVQKRLELLYPNQHELKLSDQDGVFKVELTMQLS